MTEPIREFELKKVEEMSDIGKSQTEAMSKLALSMIHLANSLNTAMTVSFIKGVVTGGVIVWLMTKAF